MTDRADEVGNVSIVDHDNEIPLHTCIADNALAEGETKDLRQT